MKNLLLYLFLFFLVACGESPILEKTFALEKGVWKYDQVFDFPIQVDDIELKYRLEMALKHADDYDFQNIYTRIKTDFPNGKSATDTVSVQLSDKFGRWYGKCGSGDCSYRVVLKDQFNFLEPGMHTIHLEQYSRTGYLEGVEEISFALFQY